MSAESNKAIVRRYFDELLNQGRLKVAEEILSPEIVFCDPFGTFQGADRLQRFFLMVRKAFPDLHYTAEPGIAEDDVVVSCFTSYGTYLGEFHGFGAFQGAPSSGRKVSVKGVSIFQIRDGKITEVRTFYDTYDQMRQLGLIPSLNATGR
jgi:steroid delta-isomerase-like uncharacterized protein